jgi:hypothetical protein
MKQLVWPNTNTPYTGGWCEKGIENSVGTTGIYTSAMAAYKAGLARGSIHTEELPLGFCAPVHLDLPNGPRDRNGNTEGDVAFRLADGKVAACAMPGNHSSLYIYPSLQAYIDDYSRANNGAVYLGWNEYAGNIKVIETEENMPSLLGLQQGRILAWAIGGRNGLDGTPNALNGESDKDIIPNNVGTEADAAIVDWYNSPDGQEWARVRLPALVEKAAKAEDLQNQLTTLQNNPIVKEVPIEKVITKNVPANLDSLTVWELISAAWEKLTKKKEQ